MIPPEVGASMFVTPINIVSIAAKVGAVVGVGMVIVLASES